MIQVLTVIKTVLLTLGPLVLPQSPFAHVDPVPQVLDLLIQLADLLLGLRGELLPLPSSLQLGLVRDLAHTQVTRGILQLRHRALGPGLHHLLTHPLHVRRHGLQLRVGAAELVREGVPVVVRDLSHQGRVALERLEVVDLAGRTVRVHLVGAHVQLGPLLLQLRTLGLGDLQIQRVVHGHRVQPVLIARGVQIQQVRGHREVLHGLTLGRLGVQLHQSHRVTVEVALEALVHRRVDRRAGDALLDVHAHVAHPGVAQQRIAPHHRVLVLLQAQALGQSRGDRDLVDLQARVRRPHGRGRVGHPRAHQLVLEDVVLALELALLQPLHDRAVGRLSGLLSRPGLGLGAQHRLQLRDLLRLEPLTQLRVRQGHLRVAVVQARPVDAHVLVGVVVRLGGAVLHLVTRTQVRREHRHAPGLVRGLGHRLAGGQRDREGDLQITAVPADQGAELRHHLLLVQRAVGVDHQVLLLEQPTLRAQRVAAGDAQGAVRTHLDAHAVQNLVEVLRRRQVLAVALGHDLVGTLGVQGPGELAGGVAPLALADRVLVVDLGVVVHRLVRDDEPRLTDGSRGHRPVEHGHVVRGLHHLAHRTAVEAGDDGERAHDHVQLGVVLEELDLGGQALGLGLGRIHLRIHDQRDDALVPVQVRELVTDHQRTHLAVGTTDLVALSELLGHHDAIIEVPAAEGHLRHSRRLGDRGGVQQVRRRHLLTVVGVELHELGVRVLHQRRAVIELTTGDGPVRVHLGGVHQVAHQALVGGTGGDHRVVEAVGVVGELGDVPAARAHPGAVEVVVVRVQVAPALLSPVGRQQRGLLLELVAVAHALGLGLQDRLAPALTQALLRRTLDEVDLVTDVGEPAVGAVQRRGVAQLRATGDQVGGDLVHDRLGHDLLVAAQPGALLHGEVLPRLLGHHVSLVAGHEHVVLRGGEGRDDLATITRGEDLTDLAGDGLGLTTGHLGHPLGRVLHHALAIDQNRGGHRAVALQRLTDVATHGAHELRGVLLHRDSALLVELDQLVADRVVQPVRAHQLSRGERCRRVDAGGALDLRHRADRRGDVADVAPHPTTLLAHHVRGDHRRVEAAEGRGVPIPPGLVGAHRGVQHLLGVLADLLGRIPDVHQVLHRHGVLGLTLHRVRGQVADLAQTRLVLLRGHTRTQQRSLRVRQHIPVRTLDRGHARVTGELRAVLAGGDHLGVLLGLTDQALRIELSSERLTSRVHRLTQEPLTGHALALEHALVVRRQEVPRRVRTTRDVTPDHDLLPTRGVAVDGHEVRGRLVRGLDRPAGASHRGLDLAGLTDHGLAVPTLDRLALCVAQQVHSLLRRRGVPGDPLRRGSRGGEVGAHALVDHAADEVLVLAGVHHADRDLGPGQLRGDLTGLTIAHDRVRGAGLRQLSEDRQGPVQTLTGHHLGRVHPRLGLTVADRHLGAHPGHDPVPDVLVLLATHPMSQGRQARLVHHRVDRTHVAQPRAIAGAGHALQAQAGVVRTLHRAVVRGVGGLSHGLHRPQLEVAQLGTQLEHRAAAREAGIVRGDRQTLTHRAGLSPHLTAAARAVGLGVVVAEHVHELGVVLGVDRIRDRVLGEPTLVAGHRLREGVLEAAQGGAQTQSGVVDPCLRPVALALGIGVAHLLRPDATLGVLADRSGLGDQQRAAGLLPGIVHHPVEHVLVEVLAQASLGLLRVHGVGHEMRPPFRFRVTGPWAGTV